MVAGLTLDQFVSILSQAGVPLVIGTFVSGIFQHLKLSPSVPFVQEGTAFMNRVVLAALCLVVQVLFNLIHHDPITWNVVSQAAVDYFGASAAYTHFFKVFNQA